jgi:hypothetical protein
VICSAFMDNKISSSDLSLCCTDKPCAFASAACDSALGRCVSRYAHRLANVAFQEVWKIVVIVLKELDY